MNIHRAIEAYVQYYSIKPSRIGLIPMFLIYVFQRYSIRKIDTRLSRAKTI